MGVGEKIVQLELFYHDRIAGRILGMVDIVSLVEKSIETVNRDDAAKMAQKFQKGKFDFNDLLTQMQQMKKMGGMGAMMKLLPGLGNMASQLEGAGLDDSFIKKQEAIIFSMTKAERANPELLNAKRRIRIAAGSGTTVQDINKLTKQLEGMQKMMKSMRKMGSGKMMGMMNKMMGGKMDDLEMMAQSMDPNTLADDMSALGPNPFAPGGPMANAGGLGDLSSLLGGKKK